MSATTVDSLLHRLAIVEAIEVPAGEAGVVAYDKTGAKRIYIPVLSVYLDLRPEMAGARATVRPGLVLLRERLHQIAQTLEPRGAAFDAVHADATRIQQYLDEHVSANTQGLAIFSGAHTTCSRRSRPRSRLRARSRPALCPTFSSLHGCAARVRSRSS